MKGEVGRTPQKAGTPKKQTMPLTKILFLKIMPTLKRLLKKALPNW